MPSRAQHGYTIYAQDEVQHGASNEVITFLDPGGEVTASRWCARLNSLATTLDARGKTISLPDGWYWVEKACPILYTGRATEYGKSLRRRNEC